MKGRPQTANVQAQTLRTNTHAPLPVGRPHAIQPVRRPVPPQAYRPCASPRCLQTLPVSQRTGNHQARVAPTNASVRPVSSRPTLPQPVVQPSAVRANPVANRPVPPNQVNASRPASPQQSAAQIGQRVVQTIKVFPNLHPGAALPVDRNNVFKLDALTDQYRLRRLNSHFVSIPNQRYNFVTTTRGELLLHNRYRHPSLAEGQQVLYAGEASFNNGKLDWWSNASGHYQPDDDYAKQAALPMERFFTYQQILKGEHKKITARGAEKSSSSAK